MDTRDESGYAARWKPKGTSGETTVTEREWLACVEPGIVRECMAGRVSARKVRLALCGCLRSPKIWSRLTAPASRRAVEVGETFADGTANLQQLGQARKQANAVAGREWRKTNSNPPAVYLANHVCLQDRNLLSFLHLAYGYLQQLRPQVSLLRCIFGNPFLPVTIAPAVLTWNDGLVVRLSQTAYNERHLPEGTLDNGRLAVLADALEEVGCADAEILGHLRGPGPHVRGCWPVDSCLGKS